MIFLAIFVKKENYKNNIIMISSVKFLFRAACLILFATTLSFEALAWHREGHETIAKVAELNLKPSTRRTVEKYLGGHSIVYYAKWMDQVRKLPQYAATDKWHTIRVDAEGNYTPSETGDAIYAVELAMKTLENYKELPDSVVALNIKYLLHFVGDMHCPSHVYFEGRDQAFKITIQDKDAKKRAYNFHSIWDFALIRANRIMSATEWATELDGVLTKQQKKDMAAGTPRDWLKSNAERNVHMFEWVNPDSKPADPMFVINGMRLIETNISYAGIRLASILNAIFK